MWHRTLTVAVITILFATPAWAHTGAGASGGFLHGFTHPLSGLDHFLAMVAVGMWSAFLGRPLVWVLPVTFPLIMIVGGAFAVLGVPVPMVEGLIAASVVVLGVAILVGWRAPAAVAVAMIATFGFVHGYAHGTELPHAALPAAYASGFVLATVLLHLSGIALGLALTRQPVGMMPLRTVGALIAATGVWLAAAPLAIS